MRAFLAFAVSAILIAACGGAHAMGPYGSPELETNEDEVSMGVGYFGYGTEWKPSGGNYTNVQIRQQQGYLQILGRGLSLTERGGSFLRIGGADFDDGAGFSSGYKLFGTVGMKDTWLGGDRGRFQLGSILQASYYSGYESTATLSNGGVATAKVSGMWDIGLGVAVQMKLSRSAFLYAGPQFVYSSAKVERSAGSAGDSTDYGESSYVGGFAGGMLKLSRGWFLVAEGQYRSDFSAGAALSYSFD